MKKILLFGLLLFLVYVNLAQAKKTIIADEVDGTNYTYGYQLGEELATRQVEFRGNVLWQGVYDAIDQAQSRLSAEEMALVLEEVKVSGNAIANSGPTATPAESRPPKAYRLKGEKYLGENAGKEGIVSLGNGLQYRVIKSGVGKKPKGTDAVLVNYRGKKVDGSQFSSSYVGDVSTPQEFIVNKTVPGLAQALKMMREGDHWEITIPTRLAYRDTTPLAGQTVIFDIELVEILPEFH